MISPNTSNEVDLAISGLLEEFVRKTRLNTGDNPKLTIDIGLPDRSQSPAVVRVTNQKEIEWLPTLHNRVDLFADLEKGLEVTIHEDLKRYYGAYWSEGICCQSSQGMVQLIQVWNATDLELLRENLMGHAFMKTKKRQALTFFFGLGEGENMLTIDNATGQIYMEIAGRRPHLQLANNLADYLQTLQVTLQPYGSV